MKIIRKRAVMDAFEWNGSNLDELLDFVCENGNSKISSAGDACDRYTFLPNAKNKSLTIKDALDGDFSILSGDFIVISESTIICYSRKAFNQLFVKV